MSLDFYWTNLFWSKGINFGVTLKGSLPDIKNDGHFQLFVDFHNPSMSRSSDQNALKGGGRSPKAALK